MHKPSEALQQSARDILKRAGYQTGNLWHIDDVKIKCASEISDEDAMNILERAMDSEVISQEIYESIEYALDCEGFKTK
ncbi:hypothetical protein [Leptospira phage LE4]|uniref:Uncharacterized protein n=1 Tax=Leptospira phage LE4 TaxID=2041383 RepID=A0A343LEF8_9CAUD|nr:hypothetical protein HWB34_gp55 [Leptospira phage LE4]ATN95068.1 hypothetical protein [Leptospira phage LE4]